MENPTTTATLLALALALAKVAERLFDWLVKKMKKEDEKTNVVTFDPETSRVIREIWQHTEKNNTVIARTDQLGVPMVYGPRQEVHELAAAVERIENKLDKNDDE